MKFCLFITLCTCLVFHGVAAAENPALEKLGDGEYSFYSTEIVSSSLITKTTDLGFSYIYTCNSKNAAKVRALFTRIDGESITIENTTAKRILQFLKYQKISETKISNVKTIYAYSPRGQVYIQNAGQKINLQIAVNNQTTTVGWPVILGSY